MTPERAKELFGECIKGYPSDGNQLAMIHRFANLCQAEALDEVQHQFANELDANWCLMKAAELRKQS